MHPELQRLLLFATVNKTHLSYKRGRWTNRCTQCGMSAPHRPIMSVFRWASPDGRIADLAKDRRTAKCIAPLAGASST